MSSLLRRCLPSVSRLPRPPTRTFLRFNSSDSTRDQDEDQSSTGPNELKDGEHDDIFYNLPDPIFDNVYDHYFEPSKRAPVRPDSLIRDTNHIPFFFDLEDAQQAWEEPVDFESPRSEVDDEGEPFDAETAEEENSPLHHLPIPLNDLGLLHRYPLLTRRVVQQTGKGKIQSQYALVLVGNGEGLVGLGEGKAENMAQASEKAFAQAVRNMDYVDRFEDRTLWTGLDTKLGATRILMRPRPVGFGLACAPGIHQVLKAAGIKDCSAKVWGSRNKLNVAKAAIRVLHAGHAPLAMGNGIGGRARRLEAGSGMRGKDAVERERGRRIVDGRTW